MARKHRKGFVLLAAVVLCLTATFWSGAALALGPNTPVSPEGLLPMPEVGLGRASGPFMGNGELLEGGPMEIPEYDLNVPTVDELMGLVPPGQESVIGVDSRVRITNTTAYPSRAIAYLVVTFSNGSRGSCTGWYIGPGVLATAGHCVYGRPGGWARYINVYPGRNGNLAPYGYTTKRRVWSVTGWTSSGDWNYDYGAIQTNTYKGNTVGWFGFFWQSSNVFSGVYNVRGYPGDKPAGTLWTMAGYVSPVWTRKLFYRMDTAGGQSGSPLYQNRAAGPYGAGIHAYGAYTIGNYQYNSATRITQAAFNNLVAWRNYPY